MTNSKDEAKQILEQQQVNKVQWLKDNMRDVLDAVRQNLGAEDENDSSRDERIERMEADDIVAYYTGWHLGDRNWGYKLVSMYKQIQRGLFK